MLPIWHGVVYPCHPDLFTPREWVRGVGGKGMWPSSKLIVVFAMHGNYLP